MCVPFPKAGKEPLAVKVAIGAALMEGELSAKGAALALFRGKLTGATRLNCDICYKEYDYALDEEIELLISDGVYNDKDKETREAVIEQKGAIDLEEILRGEIASIECDYHRCDNCQKR